MSISRREAIIQAVVAALGGTGTPVTSGAVYRVPVTALPKTTTLAYVVKPLEEKQTFIAAGYTKRELTLGVGCIGRVNPDIGPVDGQIDPLLTFAVTALMGSGSAVPPMVLEISELETIWEEQEGELYTVNALQKFIVKYMTSRTDQAVAGN